MFKEVTELFTLDEVASQLVNLPSADALNAFNAVVEVFEEV